MRAGYTVPHLKPFTRQEKTLNVISLIFAHPSTLNNGKPIGYMDASLDVRDGVRPSHTPKMGSTQPLGSVLFKVDGWANSNGFHLGPFQLELDISTPVTEYIAQG